LRELSSPSISYGEERRAAVLFMGKRRAGRRALPGLFSTGGRGKKGGCGKARPLAEKGGKEEKRDILSFRGEMEKRKKARAT